MFIEGFSGCKNVQLFLSGSGDFKVGRGSGEAAASSLPRDFSIKDRRFSLFVAQLYVTITSF
jgi:hypothetical protein